LPEANKDIVMDMLNRVLKDVNINTPRDVIFGPQEIRSTAYGISLMLPNGWAAASILGELYGIEPLSRQSGRIYVTGRAASVAEVIRSHSVELDMGFVRILPASTPFVDKSQVSIHGLAQGVGPHQYAYVTTAITTKNNAITFAALFDESAALEFNTVVSELADSVKDIAT
jgi:hypothetical protein